jgi:prepilin-type processing-associated H-X9-DG protein
MCSAPMLARGTGVPPVRDTIIFTRPDKPDAMRTGSFLLSILALLLIVTSARGESQTDNVIGPFVGPETLVVVRGQIDHIDENALADLLISSVREPQLDVPQRDMLRRWWKSWSNIGQGPLSDFRDAGVRRVYWVLTLQDFVDPQKPTGTWIFPLDDKTDAQKVIDASGRHKLHPQRIGSAIVARQSDQSIDAANVAELPAAWTHALAAGGNAPLRIAIVPTEILRKSFEENLPSLPTAAGPAPITTWTRGVEWVAISVTLAPDPKILMVAQTPDDAKARAVADLVGRMLPQVRGQKQLIPPFFLAPSDLAELLKPTVEGNQVRWEPDFQTVLRPIIARDVRQGIRFHSATNMKQILQGLAIYANNRNGQTPRDLAALIKDQDMSQEVLIDPLNPGEKVGFIYVRPTGDWEKLPADLLVLYESTPNGQNIGYADGHVEWWPTHQQVLEQAKAAEARNRAAGEKK